MAVALAAVTSLNPKAYRRESRKAQEAFEIYRDLGKDRTTEATRNVLATRWERNVPSLKTVRGWCTAFSWVRRAEEFDADVFRRAQEAEAKRLAAERNKRKIERLRVASLRRKMATDYLLQTHGDDKGQPKALITLDPKLLKVADAFITHADDTERLDLGEPTERTEHSGTILVRQYVGIPVDEV